MSNFQLSKQADPNKIFLTKFSELEGRFDSGYYKPIFIKNENTIHRSKFLKLSSLIISITKGETPSSQGSKYLNDGIVFLRAQNLAIDGVKGSVKYISSITHNRMSRSKIYGGEVLYSMAGVIGVACIFPDNLGEANINQAIAKINFNDNLSVVSKKYLVEVLNSKICKLQAERIQTVSAQPNINFEQIKSLKIPIPPKNIQAEIVAKMDKAYQNKKDKETQAQNLLDGIDTYLLNELGINLPEQTDNSLEARIFTKKFSDIAGGRFDADYHRQFYQTIDNVLNRSKYKVKSVASISENIFQGVGRKLTNNTIYTLLKVKNIVKNNEIEFNDIEYIDLKDDSKILKIGDIISPFIGEAIKQYKFSVFPELSKKYVVDNNTGVIRLLPKINAIFISSFLMSFYGKQQINRMLGGGGVPFIGTRGIKKIKIPLPPLEKQNQIAEHISQIRHQAKRLQTEAKTELKQVKQEIETMILGGN